MKNTVYKNASIVTGLSVAERGLGFLYRIVLSRLIGAEGLGLYQVALSLFGLFLTVGTGGIPITVSRMISKCKAEKDLQGEKNALSAGLLGCLLLSLPFALVFGLFGEKMTFLFSDTRSLPVFRILLIGLCLSCVYAVFRGYYWGNKNLTFSYDNYIVKKGDTLFDIGSIYNISVDELKKINGLGTDFIVSGEILKVPKLNNSIYIVKRGDSLYSIAKKFDTTVDKIKDVNKLTSNKLVINQKILIPN
jgi:LysM repeat protein